MMADNLDIRARLTADDQASPTIKRLLDQIKRLESKLKSGLGKSPITSSIMDDKTLKRLQGAGKEIDGLTTKHLRWARAVRDSGDMTASKWRQMGDEINGYAKRFDKLTGKEKDHLKSLVKNAQAYKAVWNATHRDRLKAEDRMHDNLSRLETSYLNRRLRAERAHANQVLESRRALVRNLRRLGSSAGGGGRSIVNNPAFYGLAAAYGVGHFAGSSIRSATDLDRAEMNARINMDQSKLNARDLRNWAMPRSVELGQNPARFMQTAVEAAKAGVPEEFAKGTSEMVTMLAKTFGIEVDQAMEGMGYAIAQEMGAGRLTDMKGVNRLGNITAYLAAKTAARPDQMFSFLRTGMGSGAMLGMSQEATLAFGAAGIQAGAQGQQTARFLGSLGETLAGLSMEAKTIQGHGHRSPKDRKFLSLPGQLGYGGYADIEQRIRKDPNTAVFDLIKSFSKIKAPLDREQAMTSMFGAEFARFLANMISSPEMLDRTMQLAKEAGAQKEGANFVSEAWGEFMKSLEFFIDRIKATWSVLKSELGDVLKPFIQQFSDWVTDWYKVVQTGGIKQRFKAVLDGLTEGFLGKPGSFRDLLDSAFGEPGEGNGGQTESFFKFAKGFAEGLKSFATTFVEVFKTIGRFFGSGDAEAMGRLAAQVTGLVIALTALSPVLSVFSSMVAIIGSIVAILGGPAAIGAAAALLGEKYTPDSAKKRPGESTSDYLKRRQEHKNNLYKKSSGDGLDPSMIHPMSYRSSVDGLADQINKFGGKVERAAFMGNGITDFSSRGRSYGGSAGGLGGGGSAGGIQALSGIGTPDALLKSTPGAALPNFGMGSKGIIKSDGALNAMDQKWFGGSGGVNRESIPSFSGGGGSAADNLGAGLQGNAFLAARRARFGEEIKNDPNLRLHLAAMQMTEGISGGGTIESLMNRQDMQGSSLRKGLGFSADGQINPRSFYGPIRRGEIYGAIRKLQANPKLFEKYDAYTQRALSGSHAIGGYTDQGLPSDPNGSRRTGIPGFKISPKDGNEFTDWVGPGSSWGRGRGGAMNYRKFIEQGIAGSGQSPIGNVPTPAEAIQNVPPAMVPNNDASLGGRGGGGPVAIHINGSSHDPEALATLVQRRIDESMNWRSHDSASEYT
jgi:TP901 family phage tail tape measure protein